MHILSDADGRDTSVSRMHQKKLQYNGYGEGPKEARVERGSRGNDIVHRAVFERT